MTTILLFLVLWLLYKAAKAVNRPRKRKDTPRIENRLQSNLAALDALQQQRDIYNDLISEIDYCLESAPANREKLLKDKAMIYSKLAIVESKISRLIG